MTTYTGTSGLDTYTYGFAYSTANIDWISDSKGGNGIEVTYTSSSSSGGKDGSSSSSGSKTGTGSDSGSKTGSSTGSSVSDIFYDYERIRFSDYEVALDIEWTESAGAALALINAGFGDIDSASNPDIGRWIHTADDYTGSGSKSGSVDAHARVESVAQSMLDYYAPSISDADLVNALYTNVVGVTPTKSQQDFYVQLLEQGTYTQAGLYALAAESGLNTEDYYYDDSGSLNHNYYYTPYVDSKA